MIITRKLILAAWTTGNDSNEILSYQFMVLNDQYATEKYQTVRGAMCNARGLPPYGAALEMVIDDQTGEVVNYGWPGNPLTRTPDTPIHVI